MKVNGKTLFKVTWFKRKEINGTQNLEVEWRMIQEKSLKIHQENHPLISHREYIINSMLKKDYTGRKLVSVHQMKMILSNILYL